MLILGWVCLLWATDLALLMVIQVGMIGLGAIGTAIVVALMTNVRDQSGLARVGRRRRPHPAGFR